tara:strand:+ start:203 stop:760 length:558 start_codon:yes stop_codon:yes gene_type:complete
MYQDNLIRVFPNAFSDEFCDKLIKKFEEAATKNKERYSNTGVNFTQLNFREAGWEQEQSEMVHIFVEHAKKYAKSVGITNEWPMKYALEDIRMKKYNANDHDEFQAHVDVGDNRNCTRFLVFFVYLDDNEKGGTTFPKLKHSVECKKGSMLMFPPMWTHLHAGEKPKDKAKYMVGSYLHYVGANL